MAPSKKDSTKPSERASSATTPKINYTHALLRDNATNKLLIVPRQEIISAKNLAKLDTGDLVSHGKRDKRIRATTVLVGGEDQCQQSLKIIEKMEKPSTQVVNNKKTTTNSLINHRETDENENEIEEEEEGGGGGEESEEEVLEEIDEENEELLHMQTEKEDEVVEELKAPSPISNNSSNQILPRSTTESLTTLKRKNSPDQHEGSYMNNKRSKNIGFVSTKDHAKVVAQLAAADEQNQIYQATWMPRPVNRVTIQYFADIGNVLSNTHGDISNDDDGTIDKGDLLEKICSTLDMTEAELSANTGKSIHSTARQVIGAKYPDQSTAFADVSKEHIQAVTEYAWFAHTVEKKLNDASKIRRSMANVFASRTFLAKLKNGVQGSKSST